MWRQFWERFWMPPRASGEAVSDRRVSSLELFYDLVFVVVIALAAHALAHDVTWGGVGTFAVVFTMVWIAWLNGTLYYELHGREDGRTRTFVFVDMTLIAILAVFTVGAGTQYGREFAAVYSAMFLLMTLYWWGVQRKGDPKYVRNARRYIASMLVGAVLVGASIFAPDGVRLWLWAAYALIWTAATLRTFTRDHSLEQSATAPTESLVERFDLFTILVLGGVITGVVTGLSGSKSATTGIVAAVFGMVLAFSFWWLYFDLVGARVPPQSPRRLGLWIGAHLPITAAIAAAGAAVVRLVEYAQEPRTPAPTAWLLSGSTALFLVALVLVSATFGRHIANITGYRAVTRTLLVAAVAVLVVGAIAPVAWLFALLLVVISSVGWVIAAVRSVADGTAPSPDGR